jgi:hypothetical protein
MKEAKLRLFIHVIVLSTAFGIATGLAARFLPEYKHLVFGGVLLLYIMGLAAAAKQFRLTSKKQPDIKSEAKLRRVAFFVVLTAVFGLVAGLIRAFYRDEFWLIGVSFGMCLIGLIGLIWAKNFRIK